MSDPLKKKLRKKAKKAQRHAVEKALEPNGHHSHEKKRKTFEDIREATAGHRRSCSADARLGGA
jgi:hypothetical protein